MPCGCVLAAYLGLSLLGTSPRTVAFELEWWANNSWGLHNIYRQQGWGTVAIFTDGSRVNTVNSKSFKHYLIPSGQWAGHSIYRRPEHIAYLVDHQAKTTTLLRCTCTWELPVPQPPGPECGSLAEEHLDNAIRVGAGGVAGIPVIRYRAADSNGEHEAAFAPRFGCELLEERRTTYNLIGIPTSWFHFIVRSYVPGEPKREILYPPLGYAVRERPY